MIEPKTVFEIFLGEDVVFTERTARDVFAFLDIPESELKGGTDYHKAVFMNALVISDCASPYIDGLPRIKFIKKRKLRRKLSTKNIIRRMSPAQISEFAIYLLKELEGIETDIQVEKKKDPLPSSLVNSSPGD